ncbi:MAG: hypothetical protein M1814_002762 [Vezdaea aestivalis]|nr:MAG: hypothetical protein M1814_002762 [Vezdaea aestivalis]
MAELGPKYQAALTFQAEDEIGGSPTGYYTRHDRSRHSNYSAILIDDVLLLPQIDRPGKSSSSSAPPNSLANLLVKMGFGDVDNLVEAIGQAAPAGDPHYRAHDRAINAAVRFYEGHPGPMLNTYMRQQMNLEAWYTRCRPQVLSWLRDRYFAEFRDVEFPPSNHDPNRGPSPALLTCQLVVLDDGTPRPRTHELEYMMACLNPHERLAFAVWLRNYSYTVRFGFYWAPDRNRRRILLTPSWTLVFQIEDCHPFREGLDDWTESGIGLKTSGLNVAGSSDYRLSRLSDSFGRHDEDFESVEDESVEGDYDSEEIERDENGRTVPLNRLSGDLLRRMGFLPDDSESEDSEPEDSELEDSDLADSESEDFELEHARDHLNSFFEWDDDLLATLQVWL